LQFLKKNKGKKIMFVGDSLSLNQWQSLACMLHSSVPNSTYTLTTQGSISTYTFKVVVITKSTLVLVKLNRKPG